MIAKLIYPEIKQIETEEECTCDLSPNREGLACDVCIAQSEELYSDELPY